MTNSNEIETKVDVLLKNYGVSFSAKYMGETVKWEGQKVDHFRVSIGKLETDFYMGLGNRKATIPMPTPPYRKNTLAYEEWEKRSMKPTKPSAASVISLLIIDSSASDQCFKDWCVEFGYNDDSISALNIYNACCEIGFAMKKEFSKAQIKELSEALQDY